MGTDEPITYVTAEDIHAIHDAVIAEDPDATHGVGSVQISWFHAKAKDRNHSSEVSAVA